MKLNPILLAAAAVCVAGNTPAFAQGSPSDAASYHLLRPVPSEQLREITGDRPDGTESPTTVDAGHVQIEMSLIDYSRDREPGTSVEAIATGATNLRIGLLTDLELQVLFDSYTREEVESAGVTDRTAGFSDITLRPKFNLWGNDSGPTALAIMPAVKIPTSTDLSNDEIEGALVVPFGMDLSDRFALGLMAEIDWVYDETDNDYDSELFHTAVLGFAFNDAIGIYVEYIGIAGSGAYQPFFSSGATMKLSENLVLDAGTVIGLNDAANDLQIFSGFTVRF